MAFTNKLQQIVYPYDASKYDFTKEMCSGRTTATVLSLISTAMFFPNTPIEIHKFTLLDDSHEWSEGELNILGGYYNMVEYVLSKLDFKFFVLDRTSHTLTYNIY